MPHIGVIVVTYNSILYLDDLLESLKQVKTEGFNVSYIFVDNNSQDETIAFIKKQFGDAYIIQTGENAGFAKGNNIGYAKAKELGCDYLYLLNHDTIVDPSFLQEALGVFSLDEKIAIVQSNLRLYPQTHLLNNMGNMTHYLGFGFCDWYKEPISLVNQDQEITYASGAALMVRRALVDQVGLFEDDFFMYADDQDLCWKMQLLGHKIYLSAKSIVYHKYSFSKSIKQYYWMERNRLMMIFLNYKLPTLILFLPMLIFFDLLILIHSFFSGMYQEKGKVYAYFLKKEHWNSLWKRRHKRQEYRVIDDAEILQRFSGTIRAGEVHSNLLKYLVNPILFLYFFVAKCLIFW